MVRTPSHSKRRSPRFGRLSRIWATKRQGCIIFFLFFFCPNSISLFYLKSGCWGRTGFRYSSFEFTLREGVNKKKSKMLWACPISSPPPSTPLGNISRLFFSLFNNYFTRNCNQTGVTIQKNYFKKKSFSGHASIFYIFSTFVSPSLNTKLIFCFPIITVYVWVYI